MISLHDGRLLSVANYGDPQGRPVFHFHGLGSSRLEAGVPPWTQTAHRLGIRLIAVERPGMGRSTFQRNRAMLDWPRDVAELADAMEIDRFGVIGFSAGGPYALACAYHMPERLTGAAVVGSDAPHDTADGRAVLDSRTRRSDWLSGKHPALFRAVLWFVVKSNDNRGMDERVKALFGEALCRRDLEILTSRETRERFDLAVKEGHLTGVRGMAWDWTITTRPWGFRLEEVTFPIDLFQGEADTLNCAEGARYLVRTLPRCRARFYPDEGHFSVSVNYCEDILAAAGGMPGLLAEPSISEASVPDADCESGGV